MRLTKGSHDPRRSAWRGIAAVLPTPPRSTREARRPPTGGAACKDSPRMHGRQLSIRRSSRWPGWRRRRAWTTPLSDRARRRGAGARLRSGIPARSSRPAGLSCSAAVLTRGVIRETSTSSGATCARSRVAADSYWRRCAPSRVVAHAMKTGCRGRRVHARRDRRAERSDPRDRDRAAPERPAAA